MIKFDFVIGNPPYVGGGENRSRKEGRYLYKQIWNECKKFTENLLFLTPSSFLYLKKNEFTYYEHIGNFPGVGQDVAIFQKNINDPILLYTKSETEKRNEIIKQNSIENSLYERLKTAKKELQEKKIPGINFSYVYAFSKGIPVPEGYLGVPIRNGHLRVFMPGEIPYRINGNNIPVIVVYLSAYKIEKELKEYLLSKKEEIESYFNTASIVMGFKCIANI